MKILMQYSLLFKNQNQFSQMALDQVHEQNNHTIKSCGGATDLVNKVEVRIDLGVMVGPEVTRIINEFEESMKLEVPEEDDPNLHLHHEDSATYKKRFSSDVRTLSICEPIPKNNFCIWCTPEIDTEKPFAPSNSEITKMRNECEHKSEIAKIVFGNEILNTP